MRYLTKILAASLLASTATAELPNCPPSIELIGVVRLSGERSDASGLNGSLEDGSPANRFGGLSAMEYTGQGDRFLLLADRGAGDGAVDYPCRFHEAELTVDPITCKIEFRLITTRMLIAPSGESLVGSLTAHDADLHQIDPKRWTAFDPEGIRRLPDGNLLISDEYGPHVVVADPSGQVIEEYHTPDNFRLSLPTHGEHAQGISPNRGLEGIAITPLGTRAIAVLQSPLIQDGKIEADKCLGLNCRWLVFNAEHACERQLDYCLAALTTGVSEILAIDEDRFLVLERDSNAGHEAQIKRIFLADISQASDVMNLASLPANEVPADVAPVEKALFIDLLDERFGLGGELAAEKPEGLSWGKPLPDGRRTLWVCCDNDFDPQRTSDIYCFAVADFFLGLKISVAVPK